MRRNRPASTRGTRGCAVAVALALAAFPAAAEKPTHRLDASRWLAAPAHVENLTVWPVFTDAPVDSGDLVSLAEATASGVAKVREKSGSGQVNELVLENRGDHPILSENYYARMKDLRHPIWGDRFARIRTAFYSEGFKYIRSSDGNNELYNVVSDPNEMRNLIGSDASRAERFDAALETFMNGKAGTPEAAVDRVSPEEIEQLRALGYL